MTVPSIAGSIVQIQSTNKSSSQNISVPSDAKLCIVAAAFWEDPGTTFSSLSLGGDSLIAVATQNNDTGYGFTTIWMRVNPKTGTQSLAWEWGRAIDEGANIFVIFLKDVDVSGDPIRGSGTGKHASLAESSSFASSANDLCLCVGYSYNTTDCNASPSGAGQTEIADSTVYNSCQGAIGTKQGSSGNTTMKVGGDYCTIAAVSIKGSADPIVIDGAVASMFGNVQVGAVYLGHVTITGEIASMFGNVQVGAVYLGHVTITGEIASMFGNVQVGEVIVEDNIPALGEGDTSGFVFWMLANSYYQNMVACENGAGLEEPTGYNSATWAEIFFT